MFKGVKKMVVVENLLYVLDTEVSFMIPPVDSVNHYWITFISYISLFDRILWVFGICIFLSWFTVGQISPSMTLNSSQNVALPPWCRECPRLIL